MLMFCWCSVDTQLTLCWHLLPSEVTSIITILPIRVANTSINDSSSPGVDHSGLVQSSPVRVQSTEYLDWNWTCLRFWETGSGLVQISPLWANQRKSLGVSNTLSHQIESWRETHTHRLIHVNSLATCHLSLASSHLILKLLEWDLLYTASWRIDSQPPDSYSERHPVVFAPPLLFAIVAFHWLPLTSTKHLTQIGFLDASLGPPATLNITLLSPWDCQIFST
jgi:hypothetical protein